MAHAHESKLGQRSADNVDLLETKMAKLQELPERFFKKLGDTKAVSTLAHALDGILTKLDPDSPDGKKILGGLEHTFTVVADTIDKIDFDDLANSLTDDVLPAIESMVEMVKPMLEFIEREIRGLHVLHDLYYGKVEEKGALGQFKSNFKRGGEDPEAPSFLKPLSEQPAHAPRRNADEPGINSLNAATYEDLGAASSAGHAKGVRGGREDNEAAGAEMSAATEKGVRKHAKIHSPSQLFADLGSMVGTGFADGISEKFDRR